MKETWRKVSKILWKIAKISLAIALIAYIALMTYAINDLQNDVSKLTRRIYVLENTTKPSDFYITFSDEYGTTTRQIHYKMDDDPSLTW